MNDIIEVGSERDLQVRRTIFLRLRKSTLFSISKGKKRKRRKYFICILRIKGLKAKVWAYHIDPKKIVANISIHKKILPTVFLTFAQLTSLQIEKR